MENVHAGREEARLDGGLGLPQGGDERLLSRGVEGRATAVDPRLLLRGERISLQGNDHLDRAAGIQSERDHLFREA